MLDAEDVNQVLALFDEKVSGPICDLTEDLEKFGLADEGEIEEGQELEEIFEDLKSADQKKVEQSIRKALKDIKKGVAEVVQELKSIDDEMLGEEDGDNDPEEDDDGK